jgi:hypothetical protein
MPYLPRRKKWTGWELNPRPQQQFLSMTIYLKIPNERIAIVQIPSASIFFVHAV